MEKTKSRKAVWQAVALTALMAVAMAAPLSVQAASAAEDNTTASITFTKGDISLVDAPNLNFGSHVANLSDDSFASINDVAVKVSDARGTGEGWNLTVELSPFALGEAETLQGARIEVKNPSVEAVESTLDENAPTVPTDESGVLSIVSGGEAKKVFEASAEHGKGVWQSMWGPDNTNLVIKPGTADVSVDSAPSVATMHWALQEAP